MEAILSTLGCLIGLAVLLLFFIVPMSVRLIYQYERGVVFTLGKYAGTREPGLTFIIPLLPRWVKRSENSLSNVSNEKNNCRAQR
jgi:regulator of protease activity HflC (stomatin/prohibitin superfamily)